MVHVASTVYISCKDVRSSSASTLTPLK